MLDAGAGTGLSSEPFLRAGHRVFGVEPNAEMRAAAEQWLGPRFPEGFVAVDGRAEATTLPAGAVDLVVAGQAFHWFDPVAARAEFARVLRPGGGVALVWNERLLDATPFLVGFEQLLRTFGTDYAAVSESYPTVEKIGAFFRTPEFLTAEFSNGQSFDFEGLSGRLRSSSYVPTAESPGHGPMMEELRVLFDRHQEGGEVRLEYRTRLFAGRLWAVPQVGPRACSGGL